MWFTSLHIKCWYFPPRKDRCKTAVLPTLDVQTLNKTHHTHSTLLANHRRDGFVKSHVRSDNKFPNSCCGQNQQPQARCEHKCGGVRTHKLSDAHTKNTKGEWHQQKTNRCGADLARETWLSQRKCASRLQRGHVKQRCGPFQRVSIEDDSAMEKSNETTHATTHAAPELVNRSSIYTLHRPCDLHHGHDKTSHSGPTTMQHCQDNSAEAKTKSCKQESAPENVNATQQKILSRVSANTSTHPKNLAQRSIRVVLLHRVATHTAKDH